MSPIDAWTDGIVKVLERRERLQTIDDGIAILKNLREHMTVADISGHEFLCSVQIYMEKKVVEICREATSSVSGGVDSDTRSSQLVITHRPNVALEIGSESGSAGLSHLRGSPCPCNSDPLADSTKGDDCND